MFSPTQNLFLLFTLFFPLTLAVIPQVDLPLGRINGLTCPLNPSVASYLGIPFGLPPIGNLRFRPPLPSNLTYPSIGLNATKIPPRCPQDDDTGVFESSEDCLHLNVWTPLGAVPGSLPVRVYIHGGGWKIWSGSMPFVDGCDTVSLTDTIQVNIEYRLGALGYLAHPQTLLESNTTGNWGLLDQQLALQWVKENIFYFGGNPDKILLFGQSAGAFSVLFHTVLENSKNLFSGGIVQSAPGFTSKNFKTYPLYNLSQAYHVTTKFLENLNFPNGSDVDELTFLRNASVADLLTCTPTVTDFYIYLSHPIAQVFYPVVDEHLLKMQVNEYFETGNFYDVPMMFGTVKVEGSYMFSVSTNASAITMDSVLSYLSDIYQAVEEEGDDGFNTILSLYPYSNYAEAKQPYYLMLSDIWTDIFFNCPMFHALETLSAKNKSSLYAYNFTLYPACEFHASEDGSADMDVTHCDDLYFTFFKTYQLPPPFGDCNFTTDEIGLSKAMVYSWASMARDGQPSFSNGTEWVKWESTSQFKVKLDSPLTVTATDLRYKCGVFRSYEECTDDLVGSIQTETFGSEMGLGSLDIRDVFEN